MGRTEWKQTILGVGALGTVLPASLGLGVAAVAVAGVCGIRVLGALTEELALPSVGQHKSFSFFLKRGRAMMQNIAPTYLAHAVASKSWAGFGARSGRLGSGCGRAIVHLRLLFDVGSCEFSVAHQLLALCAHHVGGMDGLA